MDFYIANHKDSTYRTTFVYVVIDIAAPAQTRNTSRVLSWGALAFMANHAGGKEVNEARRSHTCSRPCTFKEKTKPGKTTKKSAPPKTHHESHSSPATTTASRRHVIKHVPRVRPHSPASIDPRFVEIGLVQLSQSVKTTNVTHTHTHDRLIK